MLKKPLLQVALDLTDLSRALSIACSIAYRLPKEHLVMEAGTPLIKSCGVEAVEFLKKTTEVTVFADTKTVDAGRVEAESMAVAGADIVSVLALADNSTVREVVDTMHGYGGLVALDLINHPNPLNRALEALELGVDIIVYHVGVDVQKRRGITVSDLLDEVRELVSRVRESGREVLVSVAGGLKPGRVREFIDTGVDIVVVGGAIIKSSDPYRVARDILAEMGLF